MEIDTLAELGRIVRSTRKQQGLSRTEDAAALCGVSTPFLNHLENGKPTCEFDKVMQVCKRLGIKLFVKTAAG